MVMFRALAKGILATLFVLSLPTLATAGVPANLTGTVFDDLDLDGNLDPGEPGVGAVTVNLDFGADGTIDSTQLTAGGGTFGFVATAPGTYRVRIVPPAGTAQTSANPPDLVIATAGGGLVANFGLGPVANAFTSGES